MATLKDIASKDSTVFPDGTGLPAGRGTAREGRHVYESRCAACDGARGEGVGDFPALAGGRGTLAGKDPVLTVGSCWPYATTLWDYIHRAMPYPQPGALSTEEVYGATAHVLFLNDIVTEDQAISQKTLPEIQMPIRAGFVSDGRAR